MQKRGLRQISPLKVGHPANDGIGKGCMLIDFDA